MTKSADQADLDFLTPEERAWILGNEPKKRKIQATQVQDEYEMGDIMVTGLSLVKGKRLLNEQALFISRSVQKTVFGKKSKHSSTHLLDENGSAIAKLTKEFAFFVSTLLDLTIVIKIQLG